MDIVGKCQFPVTKDGAFAAAVSATVSTVPIEDAKYATFGVNGQFHYSVSFSRQVDAMLSITSSYYAALASGVITKNTNVWLTVDSKFEHLAIGGASEGIAVMLALLGLIVPSWCMATGYVDQIGETNMTIEELNKVKIRRIDKAGAKAVGAQQLKMTILLPKDNERDFAPGQIPKSVIFVDTVGEACNAVIGLSEK